MATFNNGLHDVWGKIAEPQGPSDMGVIEVEPSCDFHRVLIFPAAKILHPGLGSRDCEDERVIDPARAVARNDDLLTRAGPWCRQLKNIKWLGN